LLSLVTADYLFGGTVIIAAGTIEFYGLVGNLTCILPVPPFILMGLQTKFKELINDYLGRIQYIIVLLLFLIVFSAVSSYSANLAYSDNLSYANLSYANLYGTDLSYANLSYANLYGTDLSYANLSYANLYAAELSNATLHNSILSNATLHNAILFGSDLSNATLQNAILFGSDLTSADLTNADLTSAILTYADLTGTDLKGSDLSDALIVGLFDFADLKMDNRTILENSLIDNQGLIDYLSQWKTQGKPHLIENELELKQILVSRGFTEYYIKFIITISKLRES
jgi:hypothetical protein